jgi:hypothetical protein
VSQLVITYAHARSSREHSKILKREGWIWTPLRHPNVLECLGTEKIDDETYLVSPWMKNGDLRTFVARRLQQADCQPLDNATHAITTSNEIFWEHRIVRVSSRSSPGRNDVLRRILSRSLVLRGASLSSTSPRSFMAISNRRTSSSTMTKNRRSAILACPNYSTVNTKIHPQH